MVYPGFFSIAEDAAAQGISAMLSEAGGDFVCATAGHHMESMLAAYGSGAAQASLEAAAALRARGRVLDGNALAYLAHWVTPVIEPKRFSARFFVAAAPDGQPASIDDGDAQVDAHLQPRFEAYRPLLDRIRRGTREEKLAAYWRVANEVLAGDMKALGDRAFPLVYEDLALNPLARVEQVFRWCGLARALETDAYVSDSSTSRSDRKTVLDTNRFSATYYRDWVGKTPTEVLAAVDTVCAGSPLMRAFDPFYGPLT